MTVMKNCCPQCYRQSLSQDLITGGQFVPLSKILGDIFIFRGTDKLIAIQHFFYAVAKYVAIQESQKKPFFLPDPCNTRKVIQTRKVKLLVSRLFFLVIFKQRINDYALYFKKFHSRISFGHPLVNFNSFLNNWQMYASFSQHNYV